MTWNSKLEEMPRDGRSFDVWVVDPAHNFVGARFTDVMMRGDKSGFGILIHTKDNVLWEYLETDEGVYPEWKITHWMYAPKPPKEEEQGNEKEE